MLQITSVGFVVGVLALVPVLSFKRWRIVYGRCQENNKNTGLVI
jgi:hypothetical protein